jgi:hypothetical protein
MAIPFGHLKTNYIQMKTIVKSIILGSFLAATVVLNSCQKGTNDTDNAQYATLLNVSTDVTTSVIETNMLAAFVGTPLLTDSELSSLLKMKEEEKLARDVYSALYQKWGSQIFSNISAAESNHLNAIVLLLTNYGATDTLIGEVGVFTDIDVQTSYNKLVADATTSIEEAYKTGALIEEMDIKDLNTSLSSTTNENVIMVFDNLLKGSRNHLRAFNRQLTTLGIVYSPVFISQTDYDLIVNSSMEKGKQYQINSQSKGQKGQGNQGNGSCNN